MKVKGFCVGVVLLVCGCFDAVDFDALNDVGFPLDAGSSTRTTADAEPSLDVEMPRVDLGVDGQGGTSGDARVSDDAILLHGRWLSSGEDVAPLLSEPPFNLVRLEAQFTAQNTFQVVGTNQNNEAFVLSGQFEVLALPTGSTPGSIRLHQTLPESSVSEGIWLVEDQILRYEVVQVDPPLAGDQSPPTVSGGFGSSTGGAFGTDNVQIYRKQGAP